MSILVTRVFTCDVSKLENVCFRLPQRSSHRSADHHHALRLVICAALCPVVLSYGGNPPSSEIVSTTMVLSVPGHATAPGRPFSSNAVNQRLTAGAKWRRRSTSSSSMGDVKIVSVCDEYPEIGQSTQPQPSPRRTKTTAQRGQHRQQQRVEL